MAVKKQRAEKAMFAGKQHDFRLATDRRMRCFACNAVMNECGKICSTERTVPLAPDPFDEMERVNA